MCSRMAASILTGALPKTEIGRAAAEELIVGSDQEYEDHAVQLGQGLRYVMCAGGTPDNDNDDDDDDNEVVGRGTGRLSELRRILYEGRWTSALFDTHRWVRDLEEAYQEAWRRWVAGEGGDIWL